MSSGISTEHLKDLAKSLSTDVNMYEMARMIGGYKKAEAGGQGIDRIFHIFNIFVKARACHLLKPHIYFVLVREGKITQEQEANFILGKYDE